MKSLRQTVRVALLVISGALMATALINPAQSQIVPLAQGKDMQEAWEFVLDGREWMLGTFGSYHEHARREYVLKGEDAERFSEKIITARYPKAPADSIDAYVALLKEGAAACEGTKLTVIEQEHNTVIFERNVKKRCEDMGVQTQLVKMVFRNGSALSFSYMKKVPELGTIARNQWVELVKFATPR